MLASKGKISTRQALTILMITTFSPAIRIFPQYTANMAGKAGWVSPLVSLIPSIILIFMLDSFFKKYKDANLSDVYFNILGKIAGGAVISIYLAWILILDSLYVRYYSERLLSSIIPNTSEIFIIVFMLFFVFIAARMGIVTIARVNEIFLSMFIFIFLLTFLFAVPQIRLRNYMYISYLDAWPVVKASAVISGIWGYLLFIFFFADKINDKEHIRKLALKEMILKCFLTILLLIMIIGVLGPTLTSHISLPYFVVVKNISVLEVIERFESVLLSSWIISDFVIITVLTYIVISIIKSLFRLSGTKSMVSPVVLFIGIGSLFFFKDRFELESFSNFIALPVNIILEFIIPFVVFCIGKIRRKI